MRKALILISLFMTINLYAKPKIKTIKLKVIATTDVHGCFFPYDFTRNKPKKGSMARVCTYIDSLRNTYKDNLIVLDNGDIMQGQPVCYYSNYIKTKERNIAEQVLQFMKYDAATLGNHDIETGHAVYDKYIHNKSTPIIAANIVNTNDKSKYIKPYQIINKGGIKIAVIGMITPTIAYWLTEPLWKGLDFQNIKDVSEQCVKEIKAKENPDIVIGLFHSGWDGGITTDNLREDEVLNVAKNVDGFDLIIFGHDHRLRKETIINTKKSSVLCLNPSSEALCVADVDITVQVEKCGKELHRIVKKEIEGNLNSVENLNPNPDFMEHFSSYINEVKTYVNRKIGTITNTIYEEDAYFGSSAFIDLIHKIQLDITKADISFAAPLSFAAQINEGDVKVCDMFNLYKFENQLCVMQMTGEEIRKHLEMSYDLWVNTMKSPTDHIMLIADSGENDKQRGSFKNLAFNFDSAAGIDYFVDVTKPNGKKVEILKMSNGEPFSEKKIYKVAVNSYRASGGGELMTAGAGIPRQDLVSRMIYQTEKDLRYYLMEYIETQKTISPTPLNNWKFVPEEWTKPAIERDRVFIFDK